jgi:ribosomal protein L7/L12
MSLKDTRDEEVRAALDIETRSLFPRFYEGYIEADELAKGENALLRILANIVYEYFKNRNLRTVQESVIEVYEQKLEIEAQGTIENRRTTIIEAINKRFVFNNKALAEKIEQLSEGKPIRFSIDAQKLILKIWNDDIEENGEFTAYDITQYLQPIIPQNIQLQAEDKAQIETNLNQVIGITTSMAIHIKPIQSMRWALMLMSVEIKVDMIAVLKDFYGLGLTETKAIVDNTPAELNLFATRQEAEDELSSIYMRARELGRTVKANFHIQIKEV